jgi:hypothetical protein
MARLTALRAGRGADEFSVRLDEVVRELDRLKGSAKQARGESRAAILARLVALDAALLAEARQHLDPTTRAQLVSTAEGEVAPFAARMPADARAAAIEAAFIRLVRESAGLPVISPF